MKVKRTGTIKGMKRRNEKDRHNPGKKGMKRTGTIRGK
jgi:hypothetical protein